ncbi:rhomboid family intramembrane serine protease [Paracoccus sp. Z330]|uniref:Rhomboid family intramembrane serine protease n=1 Tax=Paracoccus onchidii TaxID=3017813 RepID=A0ABT4ZHT4_9RHOB|nr:rhomboid family intramembrane serine protease [Paracoccus onchidii]MDB6178916.1 rhomboid family intramembrane serine protease [Paracoccus onchidii]
MTDPTGAPAAVIRRKQAAFPRWAIAVIILCVLVQGAQIAATIAGYPLVSRAITGFGAFWSGMLWGSPPFFEGQKATMFISYGLLHSGIAHLAMNMISLAAIAREFVRWVPPWIMAVIYLVSQIAAALCFAWMAPVSGPMVGASGAVFGLAGALIGFVAMRVRHRGDALRQLSRNVLLLLALNVAITVLVPSIAWQAHLGGAVAGVIMGVALALAKPVAR